LAKFQIPKIGGKKREEKERKILHWYHGKNPNFWGTAACKYSILGLIKALWGKGVESVKEGHDSTALELANRAVYRAQTCESCLSQKGVGFYPWLKNFKF
jgi:hypothetical protein